MFKAVTLARSLPSILLHAYNLHVFLGDDGLKVCKQRENIV